MEITIGKNNRLLDEIISLLEEQKHPDEYDNIEPEIYIKNLELHAYVIKMLNNSN